MDTHLKLHATPLKQLTQTKTHSLHDRNAYSHPPKNVKTTTFHNNDHTNIIIPDPDITPEECKENLKHIHTTMTLLLQFQKKAELLTPYPMTFIYQNKHHMSYSYKIGTASPTNHQSRKVTCIQ